MGRIFGTDGARGIAIKEITCELAMQIGRAAAMVLTQQNHKKAKILIGKDTRISSDILESALVAGICSIGADVHLLGVVPTPAVANLVQKYKADAGVMISASHNSVEFNGIKLFANDGYKLSDEIEKQIEELILDKPHEITLADGIDLGRIYYEKDAEWDYVRGILGKIEGDLNGIKVAIDCANGSASHTAQKLFKGLGATCYFLNSEPDGTNINENCGSTHLDELCNFVVQKGCAIGIAFDGDADRCLAVDEKGKVVDGDKLLAIFSHYMKRTGNLNHNTVVVTVMSNLGFFKFAKENDICVATTNVGDRYVVEQMRTDGYNLGGEQSGHIIFSDDSTSGDGQLTGAKLLHILSHTTIKMSELSTIMTSYPQTLVNVRITNRDKGKWQKDKNVLNIIETCKEKISNEGRILIRESGTEPIVRVMVECKNYGLAVQYANVIAKAIEECGIIGL